MQGSVSQAKLHEHRKLAQSSIKFVETHSLLKARYATSRASVGGVVSNPTFDFTSRGSLLDVADTEVRNMEWVDSEQRAEEKAERENVKLLDHWIYSKGLHHKQDSEYRKNLRENISKPLVRKDSKLFSTELESCIVNIAAQQLRIKQLMETEHIIERNTKSTIQHRVPSMIPSKDANKGAKCAPDIPCTSNDVNMYDQELTMELQCLTLKKTLSDKKNELHQLMLENDKALKKIKDLKDVFLLIKISSIET